MKAISFLALLSVMAIMVVTITGQDIQIITGAGSTLVSELMEEWIEEFPEQSPKDAIVEFTTRGSVGGKDLFIEELVDFAVSDRPFSTAEQSRYFNNREDPSLSPFHLPVSLGAVVVPYRLSGWEGELLLTAHVLAEIFQGVITNWNDTRLSDLGNFNLPDMKITVVIRELPSDITYLFTDYLDAASGNWTLGKSDYPSWPFNAFAEVVPVTGTGGGVLAVENVNGAISYERFGLAQKEEVRLAKLRNQDGNYVSASASTINSAAREAVAIFPSPTDDWSVVSLVDEPGPDSWPMITFSYIIIDSDLRAKGRDGALITAFLSFINTNYAQQFADEEGLEPLPFTVRNFNNDAIKIIETAEGYDYMDFMSTLIHISGSSFPEREMDIWIKGFESQSLNPVKISYETKNSLTALDDYISCNSEFSTSMIPLQQFHLDRLDNRAPTHIPFALGAITLVYNLQFDEIGGQALNLTSDMIALIFQGNITQWNDPRLHDDGQGFDPNPMLTSDEFIYALSGPNGATWIMSDYLTKASDYWVHGRVFDIDPEAGPLFNSEHGNDIEVAEFVQNVRGSIGVVEHSIAARLNLKLANIRNKQGDYVYPTESDISDAATRGVLEGIIPDGYQDWAHVSITDANGLFSWPMTFMIYNIADEDNSCVSPTQQLAIKAFLSYINQNLAQATPSRFFLTSPPPLLKVINSDSVDFITNPTPYSLSYFLREQMLVTGTTRATSMLKSITELFETTSHTPISVEYLETTAEKAVNDRVLGTSELTITDEPLETFEFQELLRNNLQPLHFPIALDGLALVHNIPESDFAGDLRLTPSLIARIFEGLLDVWTVTEILSLNPGLSSNKQISVVVPCVSSTETLLFSQYLASAAAGSWRLGVGRGGIGQTPEFPFLTSSNFICSVGEDDIATEIQRTEGSLGFVRYDTTRKYFFRQVHVQNAYGTWLPISAEAIQAASADLALHGLPDGSSDWAGTNLINRGSRFSWPISSIIYAISFIDLRQNKAAGPIAGFLKFANSETLQTRVDAENFVRLRDDFIIVNEDTFDQIELPANVTSDSYYSVPLPPPFDGASIYGSGSVYPDRLFATWNYAFESQSFAKVIVDYEQKGSAAGKQEYMDNLSNFYCTEYPLTVAERTSLIIQDRLPMHIPAIMGGVAIGYTLPAGTLSDPLKLTASIAAKIFQGDITRWNDAELVELNPSLVARNVAITVVVRSDASTSTDMFTRYLDEAAGAEWRLGTGRTINWPVNDTIADSENSMSRIIKATDYSIGYVDYRGPRGFDFLTAELQNKAGVFVSITEADIESAADVAFRRGLPSPADSWENIEILDEAGAETWPISFMMYYIVDYNQTHRAEEAAALVGYLRYAMSDAAQSRAILDGYERIPKILAESNEASIDSILLPQDQEPLYYYQPPFPEPYYGIEVRGTTSPTLNDLWNVWSNTFIAQVPDADIRIELEVEPSTLSVESFMQRSVRFAMTEQPLPQNLWDRQKNAGYPVLTLPTGLFAVGIIYNIPELDGDLNVNADILARIQAGSILRWQHELLVDLNPTLATLSETVKLVTYANGVEHNIHSLYIEYLSKASPYFNAALQNPNTPWPANVPQVETADDMATYVANTPYSFGYVDLGTANRFARKFARMINAEGILVEMGKIPVNSAAEQAVADDIIPLGEESWHGLSLVNLKGPNTWPITSFAYTLVYQDLSDIRNGGAVIQALLRFVMNENAQERSIGEGLEPLPKLLTSYNLDTLNLITLAAGADSELYYKVPLEDPVPNGAVWPRAGVTVEASGSSFVKNIMDIWTAGFSSQSPTEVYINYDVIGSGGGVKEYIDDQVQFCISDAPLTTEQRNEVVDKARVPLHIPIVMGAVAISHNIPGYFHELQLTASVLARIFSGVITRWNDPAINSLNPQLASFNKDIVVVRRADASGSTYVLSDYLSQAAPTSQWRLGKGVGGPEHAPEFPLSTIGAYKDQGVADVIKNTPYSIGYLEYGTARLNGLQDALIENQNGEMVALDEASVEDAATEAIHTGLPRSRDNWAAFTLVNRPGELTWPLSTFSYMIFDENLIPHRTAGIATEAFAIYVLTQVAQSKVSSVGYEQLLRDVIAKNAEGISQIRSDRNDPEVSGVEDFLSIEGSVGDTPDTTTAPSVAPTGPATIIEYIQNKQNRGLVAGVVIFMLLFVIVLIVACILCCRIRRITKKFKRTQSPVVVKDDTKQDDSEIELEPSEAAVAVND